MTAKYFSSQSGRLSEFEPTSGTAPRSEPVRQVGGQDKSSLGAYFVAVGGVLAATVILRLLRPFLDAGNESLLYLPVVIACALRFGFGPAVVASIVSFCCWDYFFDVPYYALTISSAHDFVSLIIYLVVAVTTAHLAARAKVRTRESEARERETALLYRASSALSCEVDTDRSLLTLAEQIIYLCRASPCMIFVSNAQTESFETAVSLSASLLSIEKEDEIRQIAEAALEADGIVRHAVPQSAAHETGTASFAVGPETGLYVPLSVQNNKVGVLHVGPSFDGKPLSSQDERMILTLANHAAVVIARQLMAEEAKEQARETAVLDERNRLARDVHDTLSHAFTGIKFLLEAANRIGSPEQTTTCIIQARNLAIEGAQEARRSVLALRPVALEQAGNLAEALKNLSDSGVGDGKTTIDVVINGEQPQISDVVEENLLRICQEALTNALKHAEATVITVSAYFGPTSLLLTVQDNGRGFNQIDLNSGFGLTSMRERTELIHGEFTVRSVVGEGTKIIVQVPIAGDKRK